MMEIRNPMSMTRKLNQVRNSFYVYLPKQWCDHFGLSKDSEVRMEQATDGTLRVVPPSVVSEKKGYLRIEVSTDHIGNLVNLLVGSYIVGATELEMHFEDNMDMSARALVSEWIRRLPGFEILEESSDSFTIGDTSEKQLVRKILQRQFDTVKFMFTGLTAILSGTYEGSPSRIVDRDEDVDRHRYFVERLCHLALQDPSYARKIGLLPPDALGFSLAAKHVERIADHICSAVAEASRIGDVEAKIRKLANTLSQVYESTKKIFFTVDRHKQKDDINIADLASDAFRALALANKLAKSFQKLEASREKKTPNEILLTLHLERLASYCADIIEIGINRIIESQL
jgi:phosphate uptake regulator